MPEVSVVIVCMNRPDILFPCLDSLRDGNEECLLETLVVAYQFTPENLALLAEKYPWVTIVPSDGIRGFAENNNLALKRVKGHYCFILNDDTIVPPHTIEHLVHDLRTLPEDAAAVSPAIRFPDGRLQTCGRGPWSPWRYALHYLHLVDEAKPSRWNQISPRAPLGRDDKLVPGRDDRSFISSEVEKSLFQTYTLNGACFLIRTDIFRQAGWFNPRYFFTPEDIALGHVLNGLGYSVWADSAVSITHIAGGSVSAMEQAIKPARVRGSLLFYGEPLWLKLFIWCYEALRYLKHTVILWISPRASQVPPVISSGGRKAGVEKSLIMRQTALNVMRTVFSTLSPKEIFIRFKP